MATHHETVGGSGEPLQIQINELFTFQGRSDKWGFTVIPKKIVYPHQLKNVSIKD